VIVAGEGCRLVDADGREYLDGTASLWCNVHGHRHPRIDAAIAAQLGRVAHTTMLGLSHPAAVELAERLVGLAPAGLRRVFYSDNGSTAVEVALKMAYGFWHARGEWWRHRFVCLRGAYHGDTIGSVSVGGIELFDARFRPLLFATEQAEPGDAADLERAPAARARPACCCSRRATCATCGGCATSTACC
jgi:adenosylmethionine-8-amino-7-oxononanoate aminotransferase